MHLVWADSSWFMMSSCDDKATNSDGKGSELLTWECAYGVYHYLHDGCNYHGKWK